jgi:hypothetical protein
MHGKFVFSSQGLRIPSSSPLAIMSDFLGNRQQQVLLNGITSSKLSVESGVPQVTVLDPTLFLSFIND